MDYASSSSENIINHSFVPLVYAVNSIGSQDDFSLFDMFLNAITSTSLYNDSNNLPGPLLTGSSNNEKRSTARSISLFRPDDDDDDDDDSSIDDCFVDGGLKSSSKQAAGVRGSLSFTPLMAARRSGAAQSGTTNNSDAMQVDVFSYTKSLDISNSSGYTNFFHHAKIQSVSARYGLPPSKDPTGYDNIAHNLPNALQKVQKNKQRLTTASSLSYEEKEDLISSILNQYKSSFLGILQSGWFDKHVHALPSIILVICTVTSDRIEQTKQDTLLYETIEHLQYSLVPKRKCPIQIVALVKDDVTNQQADIWNKSVMNEIYINTTNQALDESQNQNHAERTNVTNSTSSTDYIPQVTILLLRPSLDLIINKDLTNNKSTSAALKKLHNATRDLSLDYYSRQGRRTREKLAKLLAAIVFNQKISNSSSGSTAEAGMTNNSIHGINPASANRRRQNVPRTIPSSSEAQPPIECSPILIRYCIKIALFYEFQLMKHEKCILFLSEAYRYVTKYYLYLLQLDSNISDCHSDDDNMSVDSTDKTYSNVSSSRSPSAHGTSSTSDVTDGSEGIEVDIHTLADTSSPTKSRSLLRRNPGHTSSKQRKFTWLHLLPKQSDDMIYQCRTIADWLNFKLILFGLESTNENGLIAVYHQFRQHTRVFGSRAFTMKYRATSLNAKPTNSASFTVNNCIDDWYEWLLITRQRTTLSQLIERYPPNLVPLSTSPKSDSITFNMDEVLATCSPWRSCVSAAEAMLRLGHEIENIKKQRICSDAQHHDINNGADQGNTLEQGPTRGELENHPAPSKISKASATRQRYIGSKGADTIEYEFQEEFEISHKGKNMKM